MPDDAGTGMEKRDMKKLLGQSKKKPINCAMAVGDSQSGGAGLVLLHKITPAKALLKDLKKQFPTAKNPCFGTVSIDEEKAPGLVTFTVNKRFPGLDRKLVKTLKGTGFRKIAIESGGGQADDDDT